MLYPSIEAKSGELEKLLLQNKLPQGMIEDFLDVLVEAIPFVAEIRNYGSSLILFRKWKSILYERYRAVYQKQVDFASHTHDDSLEEAALRQLEHFVEIEKFQIERSSDNFSINEIISEFINKLAPIHPNKISMTATALDPARRGLIKELGADAEEAYHRSKLGVAKGIYGKCIDYIDERIRLEEQDTLDFYFLAWALHGLGNIEYTRQSYKRAKDYYLHAYRLKVNLLNSKINQSRVTMSLYATKMKLRGTELADPERGPRDFNENVLALEREFGRDKKELLELNEVWTIQMGAYLSYLIGKSYLYLNEKDAAMRYLDRSRRASDEIGDEAAEIRARVFMYAYGASVDDVSPKHIVTSLGRRRTQVSQNPKVKRLISGSIPLELKLQSRQRTKEITDILTHVGVTPFAPES